MFDWPHFLTKHQIEFRQEGRDNIATHCPFCGKDVAPVHMAVSLRGRGWHCWRNEDHRGRSNARLIQALLRCTREQASALAGEKEAPSVPEENVVSMMAGFLGTKVENRPDKLELPADARLLMQKRLSRVFWNYMRDRRFDNDQIEWLVEQYKIHYAIRGPWRWRLIIPIHDERGKLLTWTARTVLPDVELRYKTLRTKAMRPDDEVALAAPGSLLLGLPLLWSCDNPRALVICEGPFDAFRITAQGAMRGVYGTCIFGLKLSEDQAEWVERLRARFRRVALLLDPDAQMLTFKVVQRLATVNCRLLSLPAGIKDPGALPPSKVDALVGEVLAA